MSGGIFVLNGEDLVAMHEQPYDSEDLLQTLLARYPDLLAGGDELAGSSRRWLLVKREAGVPDRETGGSRWSLDHLFVDQDAVPTLVEVKRSDDTRIRREVVGQMLDYAANGVVYWPAERLRSDFETRCAKEGREPEEVFEDSLGDELDPEQFWDEVEQNLRSGRVRLIFVSDLIPAELRRVIEFLNERMSPTEVLGVEIKQYVGDGDLKTLVPRIVGQTEEARIQKIGGARAPSVDVDWDYYRGRLGPERFEIFQEIFSRMEAAVLERELPWVPNLKRNYLSLSRPGGYNCCGINVRTGEPLRFWIRVPPLEELRERGQEVPDLYPQLHTDWDAHNKLWCWDVPTRDAIPDLGPAIEFASRYHPPTGPTRAS